MGKPRSWSKEYWNGPTPSANVEGLHQDESPPTLEESPLADMARARARARRRTELRREKT